MQPESLYGGKPTATATTETATPPVPLLDPDVYGDLPKPKTGELYPVEVGLAQPLKSQIADLFDAGISRADIVKGNREIARAFRESQLPADPTFVDEIGAARISAARGIASADADAHVQGWQEETRRTLRDQYGPDDAEQLLARSEKFLKSQPRLAKVLAVGGVRHKPSIAVALAAHVRRLGFF